MDLCVWLSDRREDEYGVEITGISKVGKAGGGGGAGMDCRQNSP